MSYGSYGSPRFGFGFHLTPWVRRLLIANTAIFVAMWILGPRVGSFLVQWFAFYPSGDFLTRPWGAVTYMFLHGGLWHVLLNMLVLFFFGPPLESRWGGSEFLRYYFLCGAVGVLFGFVVPGTGGVPVIGASAAVYGVMLAFAWYWPDSPIYVWGIFPIKAKYLVGFLFFLTVMSTYSDTGGGVAHFAHLGGLLVGLVYLKWGTDLGARLDRLKDVARPERFAIVPRKEDEEERRGARSRRRERARREGVDADMLDEVDRILDKISEGGMASLTPEERRVLDEVSKQRRSN